MDVPGHVVLVDHNPCPFQFKFRVVFDEDLNPPPMIWQKDVGELNEIDAVLQQYPCTHYDHAIGQDCLRLAIASPFVLIAGDGLGDAWLFFRRHGHDGAWEVRHWSRQGEIRQESVPDRASWPVHVLQKPAATEAKLLSEKGLAKQELEEKEDGGEATFPTAVCILLGKIHHRPSGRACRERFAYLPIYLPTLPS